MESDVLLLSLFLLGMFFLLTFVALSINFLSRILTRRKPKKSRKETSFKTSIENISQEINSHVLTEVLATKVISSCPVDAFTLVTSPKVHLLISETKCLGYACLQCFQSLVSLKD
ncbi:MAG: hypothetical protein ACFFAU_05230 [Candidatus Hodarchaeota archaeon]